MINFKEIGLMVIISIILAFAISLVKSLNAFLVALLAIFIVILVNVVAKKIITFFLESEIEIKLWEVRQIGFKPNSRFNKEMPAGIIMPILISLVSLGHLYWMANMVFEVKAKVSRAAKRWGLYTFSEITEWHIGLIAAWGIIANLLFAVIGYLIGFEEFARLNIYFAAFNLIPISDLDGNKVFFGSLILWSFLAILALIGLGYAFLIV
jgi:hypothetical protein